MLFVVYIGPQEPWRSSADPIVIGAFLMESDAKGFIKSHPTLKDEMVIAEVHNVWGNWKTIRDKLTADYNNATTLEGTE